MDHLFMCVYMDVSALKGRRDALKPESHMAVCTSPGVDAEY